MGGRIGGKCRRDVNSKAGGNAWSRARQTGTKGRGGKGRSNMSEVRANGKEEGLQAERMKKGLNVGVNDYLGRYPNTWVCNYQAQQPWKPW